MPTKAEIRNKTLKRLRVLEEGETPTNEVIADVEEAYDELHAYLETKNATTWDSDEDIPDDATRSVVAMLAASLADEFIVDEQRYQRLQMEAGGALTRLIILAANDYIYCETEAEYY